MMLVPSLIAAITFASAPCSAPSPRPRGVCDCTDDPPFVVPVSLWNEPALPVRAVSELAALLDSQNDSGAAARGSSSRANEGLEHCASLTPRTRGSELRSWQRRRPERSAHRAIAAAAWARTRERTR